jgi:Putative porin
MFQKAGPFPKGCSSGFAGLRPLLVGAVILLCAVRAGLCEDPSDPIINLFLQKGFITESEAAKARAQIASIRTNEVNHIPLLPKPRWGVRQAIKNIELFGDVRLRYEYRSVEDPAGGNIDLQRFRYAARVGVRGRLFDDFYYGLRLDTSSNPRSSWITFGTASSGTPYNGPFGKSKADIAVSRAYLGWRRDNWLDLELGKMPNPLYTTPMVWDPDLNPEGAAEHLQYTVGSADLFATLGQFLYEDINPISASGGLGFNGLTGQNGEDVFMLAWQGGMNYHITTNTAVKVAPVLYKYVGLRRSSADSPNVTAPFFGDPYIGEGAYLGPGTGTAAGYAGYGTASTLPGFGSIDYPLNQVGLNNLLVVEVPFEFDFKLWNLDASFFGDAAYNLEGNDRAKVAAAGYAYWLANQPTPPSIHPFAPQKNEDKAYQIGFAIGSKKGWLGRVRHPWELKTYWQHTEQYALDPNLIDSDVFEGRENLEGINVQLTYGLTPNFLASVRYAYASRINDKLGTGGSNQDIPQMNPIQSFSLLQLDLSLRF